MIQTFKFGYERLSIANIITGVCFQLYPNNDRETNFVKKYENIEKLEIKDNHDNIINTA